MKDVLGLSPNCAKERLEAEGNTVRMVEVRSKKGGRGDDARVIRIAETDAETVIYWSAFQTRAKA